MYRISEIVQRKFNYKKQSKIKRSLVRFNCRKQPPSSVENLKSKFSGVSQPVKPMWKKREYDDEPIQAIPGNEDRGLCMPLDVPDTAESVSPSPDQNACEWFCFVWVSFIFSSFVLFSVSYIMYL